MNQVIGTRYQLGNVLGQGGMASVYEAQDTQLGRTVALKILRPEFMQDHVALKHFEQEARIAARFNHPSIAQIYDVGVDARYGPFFVQEVIEGQSLDTLLPTSATNALQWTQQIASALATIHRQGIVHCDIKPQNVRVTPEGNAVLLDFGIAQAHGATINPDVVYGTPHYLAPERAQGATPAPTADIYALGVLLYELLTGRVPLNGNTPLEIVQRHIQEGIPSLRKTLPGQAGAIEALISKATARKPHDRYPSMDGLLDDLHRIVQTATTATQAFAVGPARATVSIHNKATEVMAVTPKPQSQPTAAATPPTNIPALPPTPAIEMQTGPVAPFAHGAIPAATAPPVTAPARKQKQRSWLLPFLGAAALVLVLLLLVRPRDEESPTGSTTSQTPAATIPSQPIGVPNFVGIGFDQANATAASGGMSLTIDATVQNEQPAGTILAQDPIEGAAVPSDGIVRVQVSSGPPETPSEAPPPTDDDDKGKGKDKDKDKGRGKGRDK